MPQPPTSPETTDNRVFLGWDTPLAAAAPVWLLDRWTDPESRFADASAWVVITPGAAAKRGLLARLASLAHEQEIGFLPPALMTPGEFQRAALAPGARLAGAFATAWAWAHVADTMPRDARIALAGAAADELPDDAIASAPSHVHADLCNAGVAADDVPNLLPPSAAADEDRWRVIALAQQQFARTLESAGMQDIDTLRHTRQPHRLRTARVALVGVSELTPTDVALLDAISPTPIAIIHAPPSCAQMFDHLGRLDPRAWIDRRVRIDDDHVHVVATPAEQGDAAVRSLAELGAQYSPGEVSLACADPSMVGSLARAVRHAGQPVRDARGRPARLSACASLVRAIAAFNKDPSFAAFLDVVSHPFGARLAGAADTTSALLELDRYADRHAGQWAGRESSNDRSVRAWRRTLAEALHPLRSRGESASCAAWANAWRAMLALAHPEELHQDDVRALDAVAAVLRDAAQLAQAPCGRDAFVRILDRALDTVPIPAEQIDGAIELTGWLELAHDASPCVIVAGLHDAVVPGSASPRAAGLLPDSLRAALGLATQETRLARDLFLLETLLHSRSHVRFLVPRATELGDPLRPSPVLFHDDPEAAAARLARFVRAGEQEPHASSPPTQPPEPAPPENPYRPLPRHEPIDVPQKWAVSWFKTYLASPYQFTLEYLLKRTDIRNDEGELAAGPFGTLIHEALEHFAASNARDATSEGDIELALLGAFDSLANERFEPSPAGGIVWLQLENARRRLRAFARWQAGWRSQGWRIRETEYDPDPGAQLELADGSTVLLTGRIDRIDTNEHTGEVAILDYKTSRSGDDPDKAHRKQDEWIDLQLPLYRLLARERVRELAPPDAHIRLGYVVLPEDPDAVGERFASWTQADIHDAERLAGDIVRRVREGDVWDPGAPTGRKYSHALDAIMGGRFLEPDEQEEDDA